MVTGLVISENGILKQVVEKAKRQPNYSTKLQTQIIASTPFPLTTVTPLPPKAPKLAA